MANLFLRLATGYRFLPTDDELLYLLFMKLTGRSRSPADALLVPKSNLYGKQEPWQLFDEFGPKYIPFYGADDLYFFSKLNKKTKKSKNIERTVGVTGGNWHGEDKGKKIAAEVETDEGWIQVQGLKKRFKYKNKNSRQHCGWIMYEFSLPELDGETVLCRLRKNEDAVPRATATCEEGEAEPPIEKRKTELKNVESVKLETQSNRNIVPCRLSKDEVVVARATCKGEVCRLRKNEDAVPRPRPRARATCEEGEAEPLIEKRKTELKNATNIVESVKLKTQSDPDIVPCQLRKDEVVVASATCKGEVCRPRKNEDVLVRATCKGEASTKRQKLKSENNPDFNNARCLGALEFNNNDDSLKSNTEFNRAGGESRIMEVGDNDPHDLYGFIASLLA